MSLFTRAAVCAIVGLGVLSGSLAVRADDAPDVQRLENQALVNLVQPESSKVSKAVNYFRDNKTSAAKVVPRVLLLLKAQTKDKNEEEVFQALFEALYFYGAQAKSAMPKLLEIYQTSNKSWMRARAMMALVKIDSADSRVFVALQKTLRTQGATSDVWGAARTLTLTQLGSVAQRAIPDLDRQVRALEKNNKYVAHDVYLSLREITLQNPTLPSVRESISILQTIDKTPHHRVILAFESLQKTGAPASSAVAVLLQLLNRDEEYFQSSAIETLGFIGPGINLRETKALLDILEKGVVEGGTTHFGYLAQAALIKATPEDLAGIPALTDALKSSKSTVRITAAQALTIIGVASAAAAKNLSALLRASDEKIDNDEWKEYIRLAKTIGKDEDGLIDAILEVLDSPKIFGRGKIYDEGIRANLWIALADILTKSGEQIEVAKRRMIAEKLPAAMRLTMQGERYNSLIFVGVARAAGALGSEGDASVPVLIEAIQAHKWAGSPILGNEEIHYGYVSSTTPAIEAMRALGRIGKPAESALPILKTVAESGDDESMWQTKTTAIQVAQETIKLINAAA